MEHGLSRDGTMQWINEPSAGNAAMYMFDWRNVRLRILSQDVVGLLHFEWGLLFMSYKMTLNILLRNEMDLVPGHGMSCQITCTIAFSKVWVRWCLGNRIFHTKCLSLGATQVRGKSKCCWSNGKCRSMNTKNTHAHNKPLSMPMAMKPCQVKKNSNVSEGFEDLRSKACGMRREETWDALWILWILWGAHFWNFAVASASPGFLSGWHLRTPAH